MLTQQLHNRSNGTTPLPTKPVAPSANPVVNPHPPPLNQAPVPPPAVNQAAAPPAANQAPVNTISIVNHSANKASPTTSVTRAPQPVAPDDAPPSSVPSVTPATAVVPHPTTTLTSSVSSGTNLAKLPTISTPTGLAGTRSVWESNSPDNNLGGPQPIQRQPHTSTGMIVAIGVSAIAITLMFLILIRFFLKRLRNKTKAEAEEDTCIVIPSTAFLDHPKNQEMGGVGASPSPMINRSASIASVRSNISFAKPQETSNLNYYDQSHPYGEYNNLSIHDMGANHRPTMEYLDPMGAPYTQSKAWDGSRPAQAYRSNY
ncbi:hypothetical protein PGT21_010818 [Puccinia graminis f. sp. tritici]|uniref:Uncharacterized protein n=1 Tax=Puccinia graminis f. sp. tritici TaxID=56615 RepID=A0A5B0PXH0_PUCGR|nr:hypothetical protein PGTUg99_033421 [Puccinia graminis f. sp. tritici]KAA1105527.1 hypothetical protein PGT21_010818 [Puccinia graminis f. sp. tritici]